MAQNRIRELRKARRLTVAKLAELVGISHTYLTRIENGKRGLSVPIAEALSGILEVPVSDVIGVSNGLIQKGNLSADLLVDEAVPYKPSKSDRFDLRPRQGVQPWEIKTASVDLAGVAKDAIVFVDTTALAIEGLKPLQCVIATIYDPNEFGRSWTIVRQFVPPSLLISNSSGLNHTPLDVDRGDAHIKGVIVGGYSQF